MGELVRLAPSGRSTIVVGLDGSDLSASALRRSATVAAAMGAEIVAVFVRQLPTLGATRFSGEALGVLVESLAELEERTRADVAAILQETRLCWRFEVRRGEPAHVILEVAHEVDADCIVIGAGIHGVVTSVVLSSVAAHLLHHSDISVVIVRPERDRR